jgi:hypothetical protein
MPAGDLPMSLAAVQNAELHASSPVVDNEVPMTEAAVAAAADSATAIPVPCITLPAPTVATRRKYLSSHEKIDLSTVVIAIKHNALVAQTTGALAGNLRHRDCQKTTIFVV